MARSVNNPPNPWQSAQVEFLGEPPETQLQVYEEEAKTVLSHNDSPDIPFDWSLNPYRGCFHACAYCYARPTHQYLDWGAGTDFDRRIVVKTNAHEILEMQLRRKSWRGERIAFSGVTDCYQPLEASYEITRRCLEVCRRFANPVGIITKGALVERDADLLAEINRVAEARVFMSIPFVNEEMGRKIEPFAALPSRRLRSLRVLSDAGIPTGVAIAPVIPGLNDDQIPAVLEAARDAGAKHAFLILLRLDAEVEEIFLSRLREALPLSASKVESALRSMRGGGLKSTGFGSRMIGQGPRWKLVQDMFKMHCRRLGLETTVERIAEPPRPVQRGLFDA